MRRNLIALVLVLAGCAATSQVSQVSEGALMVVISAARMADCRANGGCGLYSRTELMELAKESAAIGARMMCPAKSVVFL